MVSFMNQHCVERVDSLSLPGLQTGEHQCMLTVVAYLLSCAWQPLQVQALLNLNVTR